MLNGTVVCMPRIQTPRCRSKSEQAQIIVAYYTAYTCLKGPKFRPLIL